MYILGDIGNSETKVYLVNSKNKIVKNTTFQSKKINNNILNNKFKSLIKDYTKIDKFLFCSVVPKSFNLIKKFIFKKSKKKCFEVKDLKLKSLINVKVNYNQVGSDRLTNAISLVNNKDNFIILDFGTATTFDVIIKKDYKGGVIAPGIKIIKNIIGIDTTSAVRSGFFWGYAGLIDNIVNLIKKESGKSFKLVITGGFSDLFKSSIKNKIIQNKDITIKGLIKISKLIN
jgi:type III pantothenate kinase